MSLLFFAFTLAAAAEPQERILQYIQTDLESKFDQRLVQAMLNTDAGSLYIATLSGIERVSARTFTSPENFSGDVIRAPSNTVGLFQSQNKVFLLTRDGAIYEIDGSNSKPVLNLSLGQRPSNRPYILSNGAVGLTLDTAILTYNPSISTDNTRVSREHIHVVEGKYTSNAVFSKELGLCAAEGMTVYCQIDEAYRAQALKIAEDRPSSIRHLVFWESGNALLAVSGQNEIFVEPLASQWEPFSLSISNLPSASVRVARLWGDFLLLGTDSGVFYVDLTYRVVRKVELNFVPRVTEFFRAEDGLWVLHESGLFFIAPSQVFNWPGSQRLETLSIAQIGDGIVAGTFDGLAGVDLEADGPSWTWPSDNANGDLDTRVSALT
jgi:hypothetical protein